MTEKQLHNMLKLINEIKDDCHCLSVKDINDLQITIQSEMYCQQIKAFRDHVNNSMPADMPNCTEEQQAAYDAAWEAFYESDWTIMFGGKAVTIHNEATIYNGILDTLNELIDNCL